MRVPYRPRRPLATGGAAALCLAAAAFTGMPAATPANSATPAGRPVFTAIKDSLRHTTDKITGGYTAKRMTIEVALTPRDETGLNKELSAAYTKGSGQYHKFLPKGQFDQRYAPPAATAAAVAGYLTSHHLTVARTNSPLLLRASGSSAQLSSTFRTTLSDYTDPRGVRYYANSRPVYVPNSLGRAISGVVGLTNTVRLHPLDIRPATGRVYRASAPAPAASTSCETGYPTSQQLFNEASNGTSPTLGYGGGPGCTGLTPAQTNSIYGAPAASPRTQGSGVTTALFELSGYLATDAQTWAHQFYGAGYAPNVTEKDVDGGPLGYTCPSGDTCYHNYNGDVEVDADIEQELAVAPGASIDVYDAPVDTTGQTALDEYTAIANDDTAATVSSSWGGCEFDAGEAYAEAENTIFEQMALQGQSVFAAAGDNGAFGCIASYDTAAAVIDPAAQPWVLSAGGTSLSTDNPGTSASPGHPAAGLETAWNPDNLCSPADPSASNDNQGGYFWCTATGGGGGGSSMYWGAPSWQTGAGVDSQYTTHGPANCALASSTSTPCRQVPDVSANADEFTPYAEYCTGSDITSYCGITLNGGGWFGIGGTSLAAPLWGALTADRDSYQGTRSGNIGALIYGNPGKYFNDIAAPAPSPEPGVTPATGNGMFPATAGYDEATGLGSPKFAALIEG